MNVAIKFGGWMGNGAKQSVNLDNYICNEKKVWWIDGWIGGWVDGCKSHFKDR